MPDGDLASWTETFLAVSRKHLSRVPSAAYKSHPDISLYDHARSVAAIAVCLHEAQEQAEPFLLIQGDISGVQSFLYKLASPAEEGGDEKYCQAFAGTVPIFGTAGRDRSTLLLTRIEFAPDQLAVLWRWTLFDPSASE